jgi:hypothetical protein
MNLLNLSSSPNTSLLPTVILEMHGQSVEAATGVHRSGLRKFFMCGHRCVYVHVCVYLCVCVCVCELGLGLAHGLEVSESLHHTYTPCGILCLKHLFLAEEL